MPLSSFSQILNGAPAGAARSSSICSAVCTTSSNPAAAAASSCSRSNTPSSSTVRLLMPASRSLSPSSTRATANASAA